MNTTLSRRASASTSTALCLFCRQSLQRQQASFPGNGRLATRLWTHAPSHHGQRRHFQTQQQHSVSSSSSSSSSYFSSHPAVLFGARTPAPARRFMSASTGAEPAVAEREADSTTAAPAPAPVTSFKRYTLQPETVLAMRPPPPPVAESTGEGATSEGAASEGAASAATASTEAAPVASTATETAPTAPSKTPAATAAAPAAARTDPAPAAPTPRRSRLRTPRKAAMRLTPAAVAHVRALLDMPEPKLLKVGVRNRGCSGLAYNLEYVDAPGPFDELVEQDGVRVLVDSKALFSIIGSEMDWVEEKLAQRFVFRNPNIKEECGCGESFMV